MKLVYCTYLIMILLHIGAAAQNAPISDVGNTFGYEQEVSVSIKAANFNNIGSCNLQLFYDPDIAVATSVTTGPQLPGNMNSNLQTPGVITLGWYNWQGVTLPDNTVIFVISFTRLTYGSTNITWNNEYADRQWSDGNFNVLNDLPPEDYYMDGSLTFFTKDAPVTSINAQPACPDEVIALPVKVTNFNSIGAFYLSLQYNPDALSYEAFNNDSGFPALSMDTSHPGLIVAQGQTDGIHGVSLNDSAVLFTLHFKVLDASSDLTWLADGGNCQYRGPAPEYTVLNDEPFSSHYKGANFNLIIPPSILSQPVTPDTIRAGTGTAIFEVLAEGTGKTYQWQEYITSWKNINDTDFYEGANSASLSIIHPSIGMDGYRYRCIVSGICEPDAISDGMATLHVLEGTGIYAPGVSGSFITSVGPNPFSSHIVFRLHVPERADVLLSIHDLHCRVVYETEHWNMNGGEHSFTWEPGKLQAGVYLARIVLAAENQTMINSMKIIHKNK